MTRSSLLLLSLPVLSGCAAVDRNYGVASYNASPQVVQRAETTAATYLQRRPQASAGPRYIAINTGQSVTPDSLPADEAKVFSSATAGTLYAGDPEFASTEARLEGVLFYDRTTRQVVSPQGLYLADTPPRGKSARFGDLTALYIGYGR